MQARTANGTELCNLAVSGEHQASINAGDIELGNETKKEVKHMFFDSIGVQFHFRAFFWQLFAHLFFPVFPLMVNLTGQVTTAMYTWFSPVMAYVMIVTYCLVDGSTRVGMQGALIVPLIYFLQHRLVIAMKYGSLSRTEYRKFMDCRDGALCVNYRNQMQLGSAWFEFHPDVIRFELAAASARIGARINTICFTMGNPDLSPSALNNLRTWNAFLRGHEVIDFSSPPCKQLVPNSDGSYSLSVYDLCEGLIMRASANSGSEAQLNTGKTIGVFNVVNLCIPLVLISIHYDPNVSSYTTICMVIFYICCTGLNYVYARTFFGLLYIAIVDVYRQLSTMTDLNCMIRLTDLMIHAELSHSVGAVSSYEQSRVDQRVAEIISIRSAQDVSVTAAYNPVHFEDPDEEAPSLKPTDHPCVLGERIYKDNEAHLTPRICCDEPHNIVAWTHARLVMQNFGERFKFRLELYVMAAIAMLLLMMVVGLLSLGLAADRLNVFLMPWFLQTLLSVSMCVVFLVLIMQTGAKVNETMEQHIQTLCSQALRLNRKIEHTKAELLLEKNAEKRLILQEKLERMVGTAEKIESMSAVIETNTQLKPFKVFGFTAQSSLTVSILTTAFSFYAILISMLSHRDGQVLSALGA